jgi:hypothetical protein
MLDSKGNVVTQSTILGLLSDEEIARLSMAETRAPIEGDEYISLEYPDEGVLRVGQTKVWHPSQILPRSAVREETWSAIVALIARI